VLGRRVARPFHEIGTNPTEPNSAAAVVRGAGDSLFGLIALEAPKTRRAAFIACARAKLERDDRTHSKVWHALTLSASV